MASIADPAILFFIFGIFAGWIRSNLEIPPPISRFLSLYLLMALGLKGGFALAESGLNSSVIVSLGAAVALAIAIPLLGYHVLKRILNGFDAAALAATYGSVSAVTFITAVQYLDMRAISYGGEMAAAMALMESPAIVFAVMMANHVRNLRKGLLPEANPTLVATPFRKILRESLTDGAQLLLIGAMVIGVLSGETGQSALKPFSVDLFKGMLSFFLLDMGLLAARHTSQLKGQSIWLAAYALLAPPTHALLALLMGRLLNIPQGNVILLMVLAASASYIAVPAVLRHAIPEAKPALYFGMSLGLTFPFNILVGIPLYTHLALALL